MGVRLVCVVVLLLAVGQSSGQTTLEVPKITKCCPIGQGFQDSLKGCKPFNLSFEEHIQFWPTNPGHVDLINAGMWLQSSCTCGWYKLNPRVNIIDEFRLLQTGYLQLPLQAAKTLPPNEYCLESFLEPDGTTEVLPVLCLDAPSPDDYLNVISVKFYRIGCLISIPFLIITISIYLFIEELKTIHGKILICYSSCLAIAYACLSFVQFEGDKLSYIACISIVFSIQFFFVASFFWLNVMCFHTWREITNSGICISKSDTSTRKKFLHYSIYGWGCPFLISAVPLIMNLTPTIHLSRIVIPNFGLEACQFESGTEKLSYFYGPITILLVMNIIYFLLTIYYLRVNHQEKPLNSMGDVEQVIIRKKKQIFIECLLLFCTMGLNWIFEVVSWVAMRTQYQDINIPYIIQLWIIIDTFNTLHGLIVFLVFVVRHERVRKLALDKFCFRSQYQAVQQPHVHPHAV